MRKNKKMKKTNNIFKHIFFLYIDRYLCRTQVFLKVLFKKT